MIDKQAATLELLRKIVATMRAVMPYAENDASALAEMAHDEPHDAQLQREAADAAYAVLAANAMLDTIVAALK